MKKTCKSCNTSKLLSEFHNNNYVSDGKQCYCKKCSKEKRDKYSKTIPGLILKIYLGQLSSSKKRNHNPPSYSKDELSDWILSQKNFNTLYINYIKSGDKMMIPSIDRLNDDKPYSLTNIRLVTWRVNLMKFVDNNNNRHKKPVIKTSLNGEFIEKYSSIMQAANKNTLHSSNIHHVLSGKIKSTGGYRWEYEISLIKTLKNENI